MMKIESYSFGSMTVDGKAHDKDLIIFPDKIKDHWWRKEGHSLAKEDLKEVLDYGPEVLVIGQGYMGCMDIPSETQKALQAKNICILHQKTGEATQIFNDEVQKGRRVVGAFHLTC